MQIELANGIKKRTRKKNDKIKDGKKLEQTVWNYVHLNFHTLQSPCHIINISLFFPAKKNHLNVENSSVYKSSAKH